MEIPYFDIKGVRMKKLSTRVVNPNKISCWLPDATDIWKELGIFKDVDGKPELVKPKYFIENKKHNFFWDYLKPFINKYASEMRSIDDNALIFIESDPFEILSSHQFSAEKSDDQWTKDDASNIVNASHWYDGITLYLRRFFRHFNVDTQTQKPYFFYKNIKKLFTNQLGRIKEFSKMIGNCPTLIGEFGIPFNMYNKRAYRDGNWKKHIEALTLHLDCMDANLLNFTLWNYTADNNNEWGDLWNLEDLSIFSRDQQSNPEDINSGGRAIEGFCRPFARNVTGRIISMTFNRKKKYFVLEYENNPRINAPTIIYVPNIQYPNDYIVNAPDSKIEKIREEQILKVFNKTKGLHKIEIMKK
jgi:hypothetical protein